LGILYCFLETLQHLFVGVDEHLIVELELKLQVGDNPEVHCQVAMIATHTIQQSHQFHPYLPQPDDPQGLLYLNLDRVAHQVLLEYGVEEQTSVLLQHGLGMRFLLVELNPEELAQLLERVLLSI
jgi:hypothetical protein